MYKDITLHSQTSHTVKMISKNGKHTPPLLNTQANIFTYFIKFHLTGLNLR